MRLQAPSCFVLLSQIWSYPQDLIRLRQKKVLSGKADLHVEQAGHIAVSVTDDRELQIDIANLINIPHPTVVGLKAAAALERICGG